MFGQSSYNVKLVRKGDGPLFLSADCANEQGERSRSLLNLDQHIGFQNGKLTWGRSGLSCFQGTTIKIYNTLLPRDLFAPEEMSPPEEKIVQEMMKSKLKHFNVGRSVSRSENFDMDNGIPRLIEVNGVKRTPLEHIDYNISKGSYGEWFLEVVWEKIYGLQKTKLSLDRYIENRSGKLAPVRARTLVVCLDGTDNQFGEKNTNVVRLMACLVKDDPINQEVYYQTGIGTYGPPGNSSSWIYKTVDKGIAWYLDAHVIAAYEFICSRYKQGDHICIFGFSRGAYTARALAGFIHTCGLLPANNLEHVPFAFNLYKSENTKKQCAFFLDTFAFQVKIQFVGVWDTVASVGVVYSENLPATQENPSVKHFRHALAIDESRARFKHLPWERPEKEEEDEIESNLKDILNQVKGIPEFGQGNEKYNFKRSIINLIKFERQLQTKKEVWFPGNHCDIGGGNTPNGSNFSLSYITFRWMIGECLSDISNTGILFDFDKLIEFHVPVRLNKHKEIALKSKLAWEFDKLDAGSTLHNELSSSFAWWLLEAKNWGYGREIEKSCNNKITIHQSALHRLSNPLNGTESKAEVSKRFTLSQAIQQYQSDYVVDLRSLRSGIANPLLMLSFRRESKMILSPSLVTTIAKSLSNSKTITIEDLITPKGKYVRRGNFKGSGEDVEYIRSGKLNHPFRPIISSSDKIRAIINSSDLSKLGRYIEHLEGSVSEAQYFVINTELSSPLLDVAGKLKSISSQLKSSGLNETLTQEISDCLTTLEQKVSFVHPIGGWSTVENRVRECEKELKSKK